MKTTVKATDARLSLTTLTDDPQPNAYPTVKLTNEAEVDDELVRVTSTISSHSGMNVTICGDDWTQRKPVRSFTLPARQTFTIAHRGNEIALFNSAPPAVGGVFKMTLEFADAKVLIVPVVVEP